MIEVSICKSKTLKIEIDPELISDLSELSPNLEISEFERPKYVASYEWAISAGIVVAFLKPFFDAYMKRLGDAAATATLNSLKRLFEKAKSAPERIYNSRDIKERISRQDRDDASSDVDEKETHQNMGRALAPLEIRVHEVISRDTQFNFRFIFPANLSESGVRSALLELARDQEDLFSRLIDDHRLQIARRQRPGVERRMTIEAVFDEELAQWLGLEQALALKSERSKNHE